MNSPREFGLVEQALCSEASTHTSPTACFSGADTDCRHVGGPTRRRGSSVAGVARSYIRERRPSVSLTLKGVGCRLWAARRINASTAAVERQLRTLDQYPNKALLFLKIFVFLNGSESINHVSAAAADCSSSPRTQQQGLRPNKSHGLLDAWFVEVGDVKLSQSMMMSCVRNRYRVHKNSSTQQTKSQIT